MVDNSISDTPICLDLISWGMVSFSFVDRVVQKAFKELDDGVPVGDGNYWRAVWFSFPHFSPEFRDAGVVD